MLQTLFGDDEHTASDGPYSRMMKTRKWLYLTSVAGILVADRLINIEAINGFVRFVFLSEHFIGTSVLVGLCYLIVQYVFLGIQFGSVFDIELNERFRFRREDELTAARKRASEASEKVRVVQRTVEEDSKLAGLRTKIDLIEGEIKSLTFSGTAAELKRELIAEESDDGSVAYSQLLDLRARVDSLQGERDSLSADISSRIDFLHRDNSLDDALNDAHAAEKALYEIR